MLCGYARVSTLDQNPALQLDALTGAGCQRTWTDHASGASLARPQWAALAGQLRAGDTIVVWRLDRLARSLRDLVATVDDLARREVAFRSLTEAIDTTTPAGRFTVHIFGALAEFERELIRQRTVESMGGCARPWPAVGATSHGHDRSGPGRAHDAGRRHDPRRCRPGARRQPPGSHPSPRAARPGTAVVAAAPAPRAPAVLGPRRSTGYR